MCSFASSCSEPLKVLSRSSLRNCLFNSKWVSWLIEGLLTDTPYSINWNTPYRSVELPVRRIEFTEYAILFGRTDTLFWVEGLIRRIQLVDMAYQIGKGCGGGGEGGICGGGCWSGGGGSGGEQEGGREGGFGGRFKAVNGLDGTERGYHGLYLQRTLEKYNAYDMLEELKTMFEKQAKQELFEIVKAFHACKQEEGQSVSSYLLKMKSYSDILECLGYVMPNKHGVSLILNSLNKNYDQFFQNYNMHSIGKTIHELHAMLKLYEEGIPKKAETPAMLAIREGKIQKDKKKPRGAKGKDNGKNKLAYDPKPKILSLPKRDNPAKDSVCHHCKEVFHNKVENQFGKKIKAIRSDRGGEYLSHEFVNHMKNYGIGSQLTSPYTPQHNRVSERRNRTLLNMVRSMMNLTTLSKSFWGYTLKSAARILNMVPTKNVERTPYEIWHGKDLKLSYLRVWGCEALETIGYYFYYPLENKIFVARNIEFFENILMVQEASRSHGLLESSGSDRGLELIQQKDTQPSKNTSEINNKVAPIEVEPQNIEVPIRISARIPQAPDRYGFYVDVEKYELRDLNELPNHKVALSDSEFDKWLEVINTEMQSMKDKQVWVLVDLPHNGQTVGSK
ncbi:zinc finger, CCHC-type containing protein [Tanacetum coccineum]